MVDIARIKVHSLILNSQKSKGKVVEELKIHKRVLRPESLHAASGLKFLIYSLCIFFDPIHS